MLISPVQINNNQPQFRAKFIDTPSLREVAQWAVENGKFDILNDARKKIDYSAVKIRIHLSLGTDLEGYPIAIFRRYYPKFNAPAKNPTPDEFVISGPIVYQSRRKVNPRAYGFGKIVQMSQNVYENKMFKEIVLHPPKYPDA